MGWNRQVGPFQGEIHRRYAARVPSNSPAKRLENLSKTERSGSRVARTGDVPEENAAQLCFRMLQAQSFRAGSHDHDNVGARLQLCTMQSKKLTNETLCPVSFYSTPDLSTRRNSKAGLAGRTGVLKDQEMAARFATSSALDPNEILTLSDAARPCEPTVRATRVRVWAASRR